VGDRDSPAMPIRSGKNGIRLRRKPDKGLFDVAVRSGLDTGHGDFSVLVCVAHGHGDQVRTLLHQHFPPIRVNSWNPQVSRQGVSTACDRVRQTHQGDLTAILKNLRQPMSVITAAGMPDDGGP
jgi:hypothetical protein